MIQKIMRWFRKRKFEKDVARFCKDTHLWYDRYTDEFVFEDDYRVPISFYGFDKP